MSSGGNRRLNDQDENVNVPGDVYVPNHEETQDLSESNKLTLRNYMRAVTDGNGPQSTPERPVARNTQPVPGEGESTAGAVEAENMTRISHALANQSKISERISSENGRDKWVVGKDHVPRTPFENLLKNLKAAYPLGKYVPARGMEDTRPGTVASSLKVGGAHERAASIGGPNPHQTPRTAATDETGESYTELSNAVSHALSFNRFSPTKGSPFVVDGAKTKLGWTLQFGNLGSYNPDAEEIPGSSLAGVGRSLLSGQTGHAVGPDVSAAAAFSPTQNQLGLGTSISLSDLHNVQRLIGAARRDVYTLLDANNDDGIGSDRAENTTLGTSMSIAGNQTYGALNSHREPFEGSFSLVLIVILQFVGVAVAGTLIDLIMFDFLNPDVRTFDHRNRKGNELTPGKSKPKKSGFSPDTGILEIFQTLFGVPQNLQHDFSNSFYEGLKGFYGVDPDDIASDHVGFFKSAFDSSGYYATIVRLVSNDMFDYPEIGDLYNKQDPLSATVKMFGVMRNSHTLRFIMTLVATGDQILQIQDGTRINNAKESFSRLPQAVSMGAGGSGMMMLGSVALKNLSSRFGKQKHNVYGNILAPSTTQMKATKPLGGKEFYKNYLGPASGGIYRHKADSFIPDDVRTKFEDILDATYCPFYFHDLRTNEIVSFHAFLTNLNDSYQANYDEVSGYGRVETGKIYKNTQRTLSITFKVCAVSPQDMDTMYLKLNRLLAMVYPQYTAGRGVDIDGKLARAPFSQIPASTPLLRVKVGDVIGSNASQLAVARLYGSLEGEKSLSETDSRSDIPVSSGRLSLGGQNGESESKSVASTDAVLIRGHERIFISDGTTAHSTPFTMQEGVNHAINLASGDAPVFPLQAKMQSGTTTHEGLHVLKLEKIIDANGSDVTELFNKHFYEILSGRKKKEPGLNGKRISGDRDFDPGGSERSRAAGSLKLKFGIIDEDTQASLCVPVTDILSGPGGTFSYYDSSNNKKKHPFVNTDAGLHFTGDKVGSVVKAFQDSGGQGVPGVITSIDFGNMVENTWGIDDGYRAPITLDVTISYAVVHDIPPGLDSHGLMNSAIYGVGAARSYNKGKL